MDQNALKHQNDDRRKEMIREFELRLSKIKQEIERCDEMEVNFEDEGENSPYQRKYYLTAKYMEFYKMLCKATGCSSLTGRPIERTIKLDKATPHSHLNKKVAQFVNNHSISYIPDFQDILNVVQHENEGSNPRFVSKDEITPLAKALHHHIIKELRARRHRDLHIALPELAKLMKNQENCIDPADHDETLQKKLKANRAEAMTETQVLEDFLNKVRDEAVAPKTNEKGQTLDKETVSDDENSDGDVLSDDDAHCRYDSDEDMEETVDK